MDEQDKSSKSRDALREWGFDLAAFETRAKESMQQAKGDMSEVTGALRSAMASTRQALVDLHKARQPVATELKEGFERAWDEIERAFAGARKRMHEARESEAAAAREEKPPGDSPA